MQMKMKQMDTKRSSKKILWCFVIICPFFILLLSLVLHDFGFSITICGWNIKSQYLPSCFLFFFSFFKHHFCMDNNSDGLMISCQIWLNAQNITHYCRLNVGQAHISEHWYCMYSLSNGTLWFFVVFYQTIVYGRPLSSAIIYSLDPILEAF